MKIKILTLLLALSSASLFAQKHTTKDLLGKWQGKDDRNTIGALTFLANSKVILSMRNNSSPAMDYIADFNSDPIKLDLAIKSPNGTHLSMKCLMQFVNSNTLKLQVFPDGKRPANFDPLTSQNIVVLTRTGGF